ncbi:MAG: vitamin K epoxide reductase family protein [Chloroflexota bacterium]
MTPEELSRNLRYGSGAFPARRRAQVGASLAAMGALAVIALYQMGLIAHLPDPPLPGFDADKVHGSAEAYSLLAVPDAVLGLVSYAATTMLAAMGGADRTTRQPWLPLALAGKVAFDVAQAARLTRNELTKQRALSIWSLFVAGATGAAALLVVPEARAALHCLVHPVVDDERRIGLSRPDGRTP